MNVIKWKIDPTHTAVNFWVRHMGIYNVNGHFGNVSGMVETSESYVPQRIQIEIETQSITTGNSMRDKHLMTNDFFAADAHPKLSFRSDKIVPKVVKRGFWDMLKKNTTPAYQAFGSLTMRGQTHPIVLEFEIPGPAFEDPWKAQRIGASGSTELDRTLWGIKWNQDVQSLGVLLVSNEVGITFDVQLTQA